MLALLLFFSTAFASENWLCTSQASQVQGDKVLACGVGHGADEDRARAKAFISSQAEFNRLCNASTNCKGKTVSIEPKRTTCDQEGSQWKCYRLLVFTVGTESVKVVRDQIEYEKQASKPEEEFTFETLNRRVDNQIEIYKQSMR